MLGTITPPLTLSASASGFCSRAVLRQWSTIPMLWIKEDVKSMGPDLKTCRVLVTPTTFGLYDKRLCEELESTVGEVIYNRRGRPLTSDELQEQLPGCDGLIAGLDRI